MTERIGTDSHGLHALVHGGSTPAAALVVYLATLLRSEGAAEVTGQAIAACGNGNLSRLKADVEAEIGCSVGIAQVPRMDAWHFTTIA